MPALRVDKASCPTHRRIHEIGIDRETRQAARNEVDRRFQSISSLKLSKCPQCD